MKDENKTKAELIKELKFLREEREKRVFKDITERKQTEEEIRKAKNDYLTIVNLTGDIIVTVDVEGRWTFLNDDACEFLGKPREVLLGVEFADYLHPDDVETTTTAIQEMVKIKQIVKGVINRQKTPKGWRIVEWNANPIFDGTGNYTGMQATGRDITERKQAAEALRESEEKYRAIIEQSIDGIMISDQHAKVAIWNKSMESITGIKQGDAIGKPIWETQVQLIPKEQVTPELLKQLQINLKNIIESKIDWPGESREQAIICADGTPKVVQDSSFTIKTADTIRFGTIMRDITERKQAEEDVKTAKDELQIILDSVPAIIFYKDTEGRIIRANKTLADSLKMSIKDIVGKTTEELFPREQAEKMRKDDKEVMISGKPKRNIVEPYDTPEGTRWAITDKMPYRDKEGKVTGLIGLAKDITSERRSEEELQQSYQKLKKTMDATLDTVSRIIEAKDPYTAGHQQRVSQLATAIAKEINLSPDKIKGIRIASLIHDIGKIGLPTEILSKPGKLTDIEFSLIKGHSQTGYDILKSIDFSYPVANIVLQHHEKIDGSGYPNNLKDDEILLEAKILCVADVVEAMSSHRPYRPALGIDVALEEITKNRGILYDPEVVDVCLKLFKEKRFKFE